MQDQYDYIVIGAGSAGCAVAARLADSRAGSVALLEAGGHDFNRAITIPIGIASTVPKPGPFNYGYATEPQPALNGASATSRAAGAWVAVRRSTA
jgi:choline dehydrogenase-like flavoprotein